MNLNDNKSIGNVIFVVEGEHTEFYILKLIFGKILGYQLESLTRGLKYKKYNKKVNSMSNVFIINSKESCISSLNNDEVYLDNIYNELRYEYNFDVENSAIFFCFDRDPKSNTSTALIRKLIIRLNNSRGDSGYNESGLLLLSYPCFEAYTLHNFYINAGKENFTNGDEPEQKAKGSFALNFQWVI